MFATNFINRCMNAMRPTGRTRADCIQTFSGVRYYPATPSSEDVRIVDIAHHLSMLCRYTGACKKFYSVAEHSVLVSYCVPPELALVGLMHDAAEAYTNDISRPLKRSLPDYRRIEHLNWLAIAEKFDLPERMPYEVHEADIAVLLTEQSVLMLPRQWSQGVDGEAADVEIRGLSPEQAEREFIQRYYELTIGRTARRGQPADGSPGLAALDPCYGSLEGCAA